MSQSIAGYEGDGIGTIIIGVIIFIIGMTYRERKTGITLALFLMAFAALWLSVPKVFSIPASATNESITATVGVGLVITILGGVLGVIAAGVAGKD
jgi:phosphate/sulfate permease